MQQATHTWIALRAIRLLEKEGTTPGLVEMLKKNIWRASAGAWLPQVIDIRGLPENEEPHHFRLAVYEGLHPARFITIRNRLTGKLGQSRMVSHLLMKYSDRLDFLWWGTPYHAKGQHLIPERLQSLTSVISNLLAIGDQSVKEIIPGLTIPEVPPACQTNTAQISLLLFMASHLAADAMVPFNCDSRNFSNDTGGPRIGLESFWERMIDFIFSPASMYLNGSQPETLLDRTESMDHRLGIVFDGMIPSPVNGKGGGNTEDIVMICRASFAVAGIIAPPPVYPYQQSHPLSVTFDELFTDTAEKKILLEEVTAAMLHDAVVNTAMVWKGVWESMS